jgi:flagellar basal-body rod protein FlgF
MNSELRRVSRSQSCSLSAKYKSTDFYRIFRKSSRQFFVTDRFLGAMLFRKGLSWHKSATDTKLHWTFAMDQLTSLAASGMRARMETLDMLANNIANATTAGFKADHEFYNLYLSADAQAGSTMPVIDKPWTDFSEGTLASTGNSLDLAISGKGFFVVNGPSGPLYTRNGSFRLSTRGEVQTPDGYPLLAQGGGPVTVDPSLQIEIAPDGSVHQNGREVARLNLAGFDSTSALQKRQGSYFQLMDPTIKPTSAGGEVLQGKLESANSGPAETAVRLVNVMRQFETLQRAITIGGEMNRRSVEEVAKVTG